MPPQDDFEEDEMVDPGLAVDVEKLNEEYIKSHSVSIYHITYYIYIYSEVYLYFT